MHVSHGGGIEPIGEAALAEGMAAPGEAGQ